MHSLPLLLLAACATPRGAEDPDDWYAETADYDVQEAIAYTEEPYGLDGDIGALEAAVFPTDSWGGIVYGPDEVEAWLDPLQQPNSDTCAWAEDADLPYEIEGIVTLHPRMYFKTSGCDRNSDEKYYGSYFVEDDTGAVFVLGDSKVAHFDVGDRVRMRVRAVKTSFGLDMVYAHDILEVHYEANPVHYEVASGVFGSSDLAHTRRITGTVDSETDTFGEFTIAGDDGTRWTVTLDSELTRRGHTYAPGTRLTVTGPVFYSYGTYVIVVLKVGQITVHED